MAAKVNTESFFVKVDKSYVPPITEYREAAHAMFFARTDQKLGPRGCSPAGWAA